MTSHDYDAALAQLSPDQVELEKQSTELLDKVAAAGWGFVGSGPDIVGDSVGHVSELFWLETELTLGMAQILTLDVYSDGELESVKGWTVIQEPNTGRILLEYSGPLDESYERVIEAMIGFATPDDSESKN